MLHYIIMGKSAQRRPEKTLVVNMLQTDYKSLKLILTLAEKLKYTHICDTGAHGDPVLEINEAKLIAEALLPNMRAQIALFNTASVN